ncbi:hypothetical protein [Paraburkholderia sp. RL17-347-BIC-D]|uniref:hypothetical protein n=1 Tax=Paraburkholderia sp. RL17-347-BIC-D TaxID=3031632 RepID=UPI0038B837A6
MSTIPFTPIQGYLAMPRSRPLGHVPASFGRDWALLPPGYSLRAELKALYAAMLRTFCMSDQAIRSLCRWSPSDERRATAAPAPVLEKPFDAAAQMAACAAAVPPFPLHAYATAARGPGHHWSALAGGACVLGGAAMLGWIGFDHLMHRDTATLVDFAGKVQDKRDSQPAKFQPPAAVTARAVDSAAAGTSAAVAASMPALPSAAPRFAAASNPAAATVPIPTSTSAPALRLASAHGFADKAVSHRRKLVREKGGRQHGAIPPRTARFAAADQTSHAAAIADDIARGALPKVAANVSPKPSAAGAYSPLAPARLGVDEYAGVTMSAATHVRDTAPMPRTGSSIHASGTSGTEWMNHLSQRRVTDVPDQFVK